MTRRTWIAVYLVAAALLLSWASLVAQVPAATPVATVATVPAPSPAVPNHLTDQMVWALIASYGLQFLKNCKWFTPLTPESKKGVQAAWGAALAFLTTAGVHFTIEGSFFSEGGIQIGATGISAYVLKEGLWQWASQQGWYDLIVSKRTASDAPPPVPVKVTT